jgi:cell division protein FtsB
MCFWEVTSCIGSRIVFTFLHAFEHPFKHQKDPGGCPDREQQLLNKIRQLTSQVVTLTKRNDVLTQERDTLNVEIQNLKASESFQPKVPNDDGADDDDLPLPPGISGEAARKRLFRACKKAADGWLG